MQCRRESKAASHEWQERGTLYLMRFSASLLLLAGAIITAVISFIADDGFTRLTSLQRSLDQQRHTNMRAEENVISLKRRVAGLQSDPRAIEKAARSELGMARPDEMVVIFENKSKTKKRENKKGENGESR